MTTVFNTMKQRKSIRTFNEKSIEKNDIIQVIEHTKLAPSAFNSQPWRFTIIENKSLIKKLYKLTFESKQLLTCDKVIVLHISEKELTNSLSMLPHPSMPEEKKRNDINALEKILSEQPQILISQGYIALGYLLLALQSKGIASVPMLGFDEVQVKKLLNIEGELLAMIPIGYSDNKGHTHHRLDNQLLLKFL